MLLYLSLGCGNDSITWNGVTLTKSSVSGKVDVSSATGSVTVGSVLANGMAAFAATNGWASHANVVGVAINNGMAPTRSGYTYKGFKLTVTKGLSILVENEPHEGSNYSSVAINNVSWKDGASVDIVLEWVKNSSSGSGTTTKPSCQVKWELQGGSWASGYPPASDLIQGSPYYFPLASSVTKSGYELSGWRCSAGTSPVAPGGLYIVPTLAAVTFTAEWKLSSSSGGPQVTSLPAPTWITQKKTINVGEYIKLQWYAVPNALTYWVQKHENGTYSSYADNISGTNSSSITRSTPGSITFWVYAKNGLVQSPASAGLEITWEAKAAPVVTYTLSFSGNGGGNIPLSLSRQGAGNVTIPANITPTRNGYDFKGYSTNPSASSGSYWPGNQFYLSSNATLYAIWSKQTTYTTITFDYNYAGGSSITETFTNGQSYSASSLPSIPSRYPSGEYVGSAWYSSSAGGTYYSPQQIVDLVRTATANGSRTFYIHWTRQPPAAPTWNHSGNKVTVKRGASVTLRWRPVTSADRYKIQVGSTTSTVYASSADGCQYTFNAPSNFTGTTALVWAINSSGQQSSFSATLTIEWDRGAAPTKPAEAHINANKTPPTIFTNDTRTDDNKNKYDVSWTRSTDVDGDMLGYHIYRSLDGKYKITDKNWGSVWKTVGETTLNFQELNSTLTGHKTIQVKVAAYDDCGNEGEPAYSEEVQISEKIPPTAPKITIPYEDHLLEVEQTGKIFANKEFFIGWTRSTDPDGDLIGYRIQEKRWYKDGRVEEWANARNVYDGDTNKWGHLTLRAELPRGVVKVQYRIQAYDEVGLTSPWAYSDSVEVINNVPPGRPENIQAPIPIKGGEAFLLMWDPSIDADDNLAGYYVERCFDVHTGDEIEWERIGDVDDNCMTETVPKSNTERHDTVVYRVKAYDEFGEESDWCISRTFNVSNNSSPVVTSDWVYGTYLGTHESGFSFPIIVTDDEGDPVDITVTVYPVGSGPESGRVLGSMEECETKDGGYHEFFTIPDDIFSTLPMTEFCLRITAKDAEGEGVLIYTFSRKGTRAFVTMKHPMTYPEPIIEVQFTHVDGSFPADCIRKIEVTNNANDSISRVKWEDCTAEALEGSVYAFKNKMAYSPAFNFRMSVNRGPSRASGYISRIAGRFMTISDYEETFGEGQ